MNINKVSKLLKQVKGHRNSNYSLKKLGFSSKFINSFHKYKKKHIGNIEFLFFMCGLTGTIYYISKYKNYYSETTRLISAGLTTHLLVDMLTYLGDKINTKVKVENFKPTGLKKRFLSYFFKKRFYHQVIAKKKPEYTFNHYMNTYISGYRGFQSAIIYLTFNSILFYGLYKNMKVFLSENLKIDGFANFFLAAGLSQLIAMCFSFPLENLKTRMQASQFNYSSIYGYYKKVVVGKSNKDALVGIKQEYSGFFSHLILYVIYEAFTFGIYEGLIEYFKSNKILSSDTSFFSRFYKSNKIDNVKIDIENKEQITNAEKNFKDDLEDIIYINPDIDNNEKIKKKKHEHYVESNWTQIIVASSISGIISGIITNPIDVYQINKQINPNFSISQINKSNIFIGVKERVYFLLICNTLTFVFLESIGPKYFNISLED